MGASGRRGAKVRKVLITTYDYSVEYALKLVDLKGVFHHDVEGDDIFHGVVLPGGGDIHPKWYGQHYKGARSGEPERDGFEFAVVKKARDIGLPVLGICRGHQMINVASGGTLIQDLGVRGRAHYDHHEVRPTRRASIIKDALSKNDNTLTNSLHHQAIGRLGDGLRVTAVSLDGVIEAIEDTTERGFVLGVQFHPEMGIGGYGYGVGDYDWYNGEGALKPYSMSTVSGKTFSVKDATWKDYGEEIDDSRYISIFSHFSDACYASTKSVFFEKRKKGSA